jgi:hypothetical protein
MTDKEHIENVILRTFDILKEVYNNQQELEPPKQTNKKSRSRILFPMKRGEYGKNRNKTNKPGVRISEQELRFIFVEQLNIEIGSNGSNWDVYYSVETPTIKKYYFKKNPPRCDKDGQSANFDLVIHNSFFERIALIEFKANNPDIHDYQKDFVKLTNKDEKGEKNNDILRYFIQFVENTKGLQTETSINDKMFPAKPDKHNINWQNEWGESEVIVSCISLERGSTIKKVIDFDKYSKEKT